ncbi:hypothetical protein [Phenylobacterium aquaticum]|uniref:hypothetical protein n=1 Tax=Phenylobacterium aquaticum TaxID=1763816 RepID=UPI0026F253DD|nr:hypothetical protein [Phenylobacterium aquaticum]
MEHVWFSYWWLVFPLGWFVFGAFDRWLTYQRSRDALDLIKTYTAQGKEVPPELVRRVHDDIDDDLPPGVDVRFYNRRVRRAYRRAYRWGPYGAMRSAVITGAVAAAFWFSAQMSYIPGADGPFRFVAIILGCIAVGNLAFAILGLVIPRPDRD